MTVAELRKFRQSRRIYLRQGMGAFDEAGWQEYQSLLAAFEDWINTEVDEDIRDVVRWYFSRALPDWAVAMRTYYSERQVRRIRARIYKSIVSAEKPSNFALRA